MKKSMIKSLSLAAAILATTLSSQVHADEPTATTTVEPTVTTTSADTTAAPVAEPVTTEAPATTDASTTPADTTTTTTAPVEATTTTAATDTTSVTDATTTTSTDATTTTAADTSSGVNDELSAKYKEMGIPDPRIFKHGGTHTVTLNRFLAFPTYETPQNRTLTIEAPAGNAIYLTSTNEELANLPMTDRDGDGKITFTNAQRVGDYYASSAEVVGTTMKFVYEAKSTSDKPLSTWMIDKSTNVRVLISDEDNVAIDGISVEKVATPEALALTDTDLYDIRLLDTAGSEVQIKHLADVIIPVPVGKAVERIYHYKPDTGVIEDIPFEYQDFADRVVFTVNHFSMYGAVFKPASTSNTSTSNPGTSSSNTGNTGSGTVTPLTDSNQPTPQTAPADQITAGKPAPASQVQALSQAISQKAAPSTYQASLPATGDDQTLVISLMGLGFLGLAGLAYKKTN